MAVLIYMIDFLLLVTALCGSIIESLENKQTLFFFVILLLIVIFLCAEKMIKCILEWFTYTDTDDGKLKKGESTRQWNILSITILSVLIYSILSQHQFHNQCDTIIEYDVTKCFIPFALFASYAIYDILFHKMTPIYYFHHTIGLLPVLVLFLTKYQPGTYYGVSALLTEISTLPMGMVFIAPKNQQTVWKMIFACVFFLVRPIFLTYVVMIASKCMLYETTYVLCYSFLMALYCLNLYWFRGICKKYCEIINEKKNK